MTISNLKDRVVIQRPIDSKERNSKGEIILADPLEIDICWASVVALSTRETTSLRLIGATASYRITFRYREDVRVGDEVLWESHIFTVNDPKPSQDKRWLECLCSEKIDMSISTGS